MAQVNISQSHNFTYLNNATAGVLNIYQEQQNLSSENLKLRIENAERIFVKTSAFDDALKIVAEHESGTVIGHAGTGKTTIALMVANHFFKQNYNIHFVGDISFFNFQDTIDPRAKTLIILDDLFGNHSLNTSIDKYIYMFNSILQHFERNRSDTEACTKILITSRAESFWTSRSLLPKFQDVLFKGEAILDLSTDDTPFLTEGDKAAIFKTNLTEVCSTDVEELLKNTSLFKSIANATSKVLGFPGLCKLFARHYKKVKCAEDFFKNPLIYLRPEIERLMKSKDTRATAIILLVLCNGNLAIPDLGIAETRKKSGLDRHLTQLKEFLEEKYLISTEIIATMRELTGVISVSKGDEVDFIHPSVFDCAAVILAQMNLAFAIKHCSFKFIHEYIRVCSTELDTSNSLSNVPESYFKLLAERLADEIRNRNIALSLTHQSLEHEKVADLVIHELKVDLKELVKLTDANLGQQVLYWATFCKSPYFFNTLLTMASPANRELYEAAIGCCLNGNDHALKVIISSLGPGIMKLREIQMRDIFPTLTEDESKKKSMNSLTCQLNTPLEEIRQSSKTLMSIANEYKHAAVIGMLQHTFESKILHEAALATASEYKERDIISSVGDTFDISFVDQKGDSHLHVACHYGQLELIKTALASDSSNLNLKGSNGKTLLMTAAASGNHEIFQYLLERGSDITLTDFDNNNLLHLSCIGGNLDIVKTLTSLKIFDINCRGYHLWTPLLFATCNKHGLIVQFLCENGADIDAASSDGNTAMHLAAVYGGLDLLKWLMDKQVYDINAPGKYMFTPLMMATKSGHMPVVQYLLSKGADVQITGICGCHCLHVACEEGHLAMVKFFLESKQIDIENEGNHDYPPIGAAIKHNILGVFEFLLSREANMNFKTKTGNNCLHLASSKGAIDIVSALLQMETFDIDEKGSQNQTAVMQALDNGYIDSALILMSNNADMKLTDTEGNNCLHYACENGMLAIVEKLSGDGFYSISEKENRIEYIKRACSGGHFETLKYLMTFPEEITFTSDEHWDLLLMASAGKNIDVFKTLFNMRKEFKDFNINKICPSNQLTLLFAAGSEQIVEILLKNGANPLQKDNSGNTAFHSVATKGMLSIVNTLASEWNMDINMRGVQGNTPLMNAIYKGHFDVATLLLDKGAITYTDNSQGYTCLHIACIAGGLELVKRLLHMCDPNTRDKSGRTPIMLATQCNHPEIVAFLISAGVKLTVVSYEGGTVLKIACFEGHLEIAKLILSTGKVDINDNSGPNGFTALTDGCQSGHRHIVEYLISKGADVGIKTAQGAYCLHFACMSGSVDIVRTLLEMDTFHVNIRGEKDWTPLMLAATDGHLELVRYLLRMGADVNMKNSSGSNAIHVAVTGGFLDVVKLLFHKDPSITNTRDSGGTTPILLSIYFKNAQIFEFLYENGADVTIEKYDGTNCLYTACIAGMREVAERLLSTGKFDVNKPAIHNWTPIMGACRGGQYDMFKFLTSQGAKLDCVGDSGDNIFHTACMGGNQYIVKELITSRKFDVDCIGSHGWTPLIMACEQGHAETVNVLIANGADLEFKDSRGNNCLHTACASGHIPVVRLLLLLDKLDPNEANNNDFTPLLQAVRHGHEALVEFFNDLQKR